MCRQRFKKVRALFPTSTRTVSTQTEDNYCRCTTTQATQTVPALPIEEHHSTPVEARFIPLEASLDSPEASISPPETSCSQPQASVSEPVKIIEEVARRRCHVLEITSTDRAKLLFAVLHADTRSLVEIMLQIPAVSLAVRNHILSDLDKHVAAKCIRDEKSYLYPKKFENLKDFRFGEVIKEAVTLPFLLDVLLTVCLPSRKLGNSNFIRRLVPRLSIIYSILMTCRFHELSRLQRTMSAVLLEEHMHEKVFDRLSVVGVTTSYCVAQDVLTEIGKNAYNAVVEGVKSSKKFRIVGDNINFLVGVKHERKERHGQMYNWFGSAIIMQSHSFMELPDTPQGLSRDLDLQAFIPSPADERRMRNDYGILISRVAKDLLPQLKFLYDHQDPYITGSYSEKLKQKNLVVPLQILPLNEQKYADTVQILEHYEDVLADIFQAAGKNIENVHVGGDQLTRERFTGAKGLRTGSFSARDRFDHLQPITFEMWHTSMNFLTLIFKYLYHEESLDKGTLNAEKVRLSRKNVKADVKNNYDQDKDFMLSFIRAYIAEGLCDFFGLTSIEDHPSKHLPPVGASEANLMLWRQRALDEFIDKYVWARGTDASMKNTDVSTKINLKTLTLKLPDGSISTVSIKKVVKPHASAVTSYDRVKHYGHAVLQLGLLFMQFLDNCAVPDRDRFITTIKYMMPVFKSSNNHSKYALELLRFLCHQQSTYSLRMAHQSFYGLFVYNHGKFNSNIPADLEMEHIVRKVKKLVKSSGPANIEGSLLKKTRALSGLSQIADNYDEDSKVLIRANLHKNLSANADEMKIVNDLREIQPFKCHKGRSFNKFETLTAPTDGQLNRLEFEGWIKHHKFALDFQSGK